MSNATYIGKKIKSFRSYPQFEEYSKVILTVSEDVEYSAGSDTGRTLALDCPWGTQAMAEDILSMVSGYRYQPYEAKGALLDPAAELGDGATVNNLYSGLFSMDTRFGKTFSSDISAPTEEEIDHEFPYTSRQERTTTRKLYQLTSELKVQAGLISAEVQERKTDVESIMGALTVQAGEIEAKVSSTGGTSESFGWVLDEDSWTIKSNGSDVFHVTKDGAELTGKITATSGKIGDFNITDGYLSYNGQTWQGTNTLGAYLGREGFQMGNFRVDMSGKLYATDGEFTGTVRAGSIQYGGQNGYFNGSGISPGSITGGSYGQIRAASIGSLDFSNAINTSLGYAEFSNSVFNNIEEAPYVRVKRLAIDKQVTTLSSVKVIDAATGRERTIRYVSW